MDPLLGESEDLDEYVSAEGDDSDEDSMIDKVFFEESHSEPILHQEEITKLQREVFVLREEVSQCKQTINRLQEREKSYKDRLTAHADKMVKLSAKFEDVNLGAKRPTELIRRYGDLYSEARLDAIDALDSLPEMENFDELKGKLLFSVIVLSFRSIKTSLGKLENNLKSLLGLDIGESTPADKAEAVKGLKEEISHFLCLYHGDHDISENISEVCGQVYQTLFDYPSLKSCSGLRRYMEDCVQIAWSLSLQKPPYVIKYDSQCYDEKIHSRFHLSDSDCSVIKMVLWPPLFEGESGDCVYKGVVLT